MFIMNILNHLRIQMTNKIKSILNFILASLLFFIIIFILWNMESPIIKNLEYGYYVICCIFPISMLVCLTSVLGGHYLAKHKNDF